MKPDYDKIAQLEFELGFSDERPPSRLPSIRTVDGMLKEMWTEPIYSRRPGGVIVRDAYLDRARRATSPADTYRALYNAGRHSGDIVGP